METFGLDPIHSRDYANVAQVYAQSDVQYSQLASEDNTAINVHHQAGSTRPKSIVFKLCIKAKNSFDDVQFWIKAFGEVVNVGRLDASRLAQDLQQVRSEFENLNIKERIRQAFVYQKIGDFEIHKFPDGTMIQTGQVSFNYIQSEFLTKDVVFSVAFVGKPRVIPSIINDRIERYTRVIDEISSNVFVTNIQNTRCVFNLIDPDRHDSAPNIKVDFIAIGRWL